MSCFVYQCFIPKKGCIFALISGISTSDTEMDYVRARTSGMGVNCNDIIELMNSECHSGASHVKF